MAEFQELMDFPPRPSSGWTGSWTPLRPLRQRRGQAIFFGKAQCATCHTPPYYTDNLMHNLKTERFYEKRTIAGHTMVGDGAIKTFPLRGSRTRRRISTTGV